ncbi:hypothetical protein JXA40_06630 [bacterium]|nr:hypothetical protein [candidate division CSSED10-310 bacterium]
MSRKSFSFLVPFTLAFSVSLALGVSVLYFGFYQPQKSACRAVLSGLAAKPDNPDTPAEKSMKMDEMGVERGTSVDFSPGSPAAGEPVGEISDIGGDESGQAAVPRRVLQADRESPDNGGTAGHEYAPPHDHKFSETGDPPSDESPETIPSVDDPEMQENPLIRALKMAQERKKTGENPGPADGQKSTNPFEFIFNKNSQTE